MKSINKNIIRYTDFANARPVNQSFLLKNNKERRYYSSSDVHIYFGTFLIDDTASAAYELSESAMMLFGYNSYVFDDVAKGSRMIQGQFTINFKKVGYLVDLLSEIVSLTDSGQMIKSEKAPIFSKGFDLFVHFGNEKSQIGDFQITCLKNVYINGFQTLFDANSGEPIKEMYSFIARDIDFNIREKNTPAPQKKELEITKAFLKENKIIFEFNHNIKIDDMLLTFDDSLSISTSAEDSNTIFEVAITDKEKKCLQENNIIQVKMSYKHEEQSYTKSFNHMIDMGEK